MGGFAAISQGEEETDMRCLIVLAFILTVLSAVGCPKSSVMSEQRRPDMQTVPSADSSGKKMPSWAVNRPVDPRYYIGIGIARKNLSEKDFRQIAKDNALKDLASEITVNISSEFINNIVEQSGMIEKEVRSHVRSFTKASLIGYELIDVWENSNEYWVYYRLSKAQYEIQKRLEIEKSKSLAVNMYSNAKAEEKNGEISSALLFYIQALKHIEGYVGEPLEIEINGSKVFLMNEIYSSIQHLLSNTELKANGEKRYGKMGQPLIRPLEIKAVSDIQGGRKIAVSNLPVHFSFVRGSGELVERAKTDLNGNAKSRVARISAKDKIQIVKAQLDMSGYTENNFSTILQSMIDNLSVPETKFLLTVSGISAYIEATETHFGEESDILYIESKLKYLLSDHGFTFVDDISKADIYIKIKAMSRRGSQYYKLHFAYVDATISVIDMAEGNEIYKNCFQNIKGIDLNYIKADKKAFEIAGQHISATVVPVIGFK